MKGDTRIVDQWTSKRRNKQQYSTYCVTILSDVSDGATPTSWLQGLPSRESLSFVEAQVSDRDQVIHGCRCLPKVSICHHMHPSVPRLTQPEREVEPTARTRGRFLASTDYNNVYWTYRPRIPFQLFPTSPNLHCSGLFKPTILAAQACHNHPRRTELKMSHKAWDSCVLCGWELFGSPANERAETGDTWKLQFRGRKGSGDDHPRCDSTAALTCPACSLCWPRRSRLHRRRALRRLPRRRSRRLLGAARGACPLARRHWHLPAASRP
jgi:hypothetical protein